MSKTMQAVVKVLKAGGRIGGHSLVLFDAEGNKVRKVSREVFEALMSDGSIHAVNQQFVWSK